jgi:hypothetical protein
MSAETPTSIVLVTENLGGNLHEAAGTISKLGLAQYVLTMHSLSGGATIVVYRMTAGQRDAFKVKGVLR